MNAPSLYEVGKRLADDDPPQWLVQSLEFFARLIGQPKNDAELETIERKLFASAKYLQDWLQLYILAQPAPCNASVCACSV